MCPISPHMHAWLTMGLGVSVACSPLLLRQLRLLGAANLSLSELHCLDAPRIGRHWLCWAMCLEAAKFSEETGKFSEEAGTVWWHAPHIASLSASSLCVYILDTGIIGAYDGACNGHKGIVKKAGMTGS